MTLYRKVYTKDRLPTFSGIEYITENGLLVFSANKGMGFWFNNESLANGHPEWFMEEIELPTEKEITEYYMSYEGHINNPALFGANYILNKLKG